MPLPVDFQCLLIQKSLSGECTATLERRPLEQLPPGNVLIKVQASSLNYKDALAVSGHPGITKTFPHVPGIDAWGEVLWSEDPRCSIGQEVVVTGHELGVERWGGWSELIRVPADWVLPVPAGLTGLECMQLGTAGFTAAQCVQALEMHGISPDKGDIVVTGATGGVASLSIMLLAKLGYRVIAVTGKVDATNWLQTLGAAEVVGRELLADSPRPLLSTRFAGGIDTVGGTMLAALIKQTKHRGCVAACGVAGGHELPLTVYPFILRGITLAGIDSAWCPIDDRREIWRKLGAEWYLRELSQLAQIIPLRESPAVAHAMLNGQTRGRTVIDIAMKPS